MDPAPPNPATNPAANPAASLGEAIRRAAGARAELIERLRGEGTDCWRMFHGVAEGRPGLTIDRYRDLVLVQTFREPLAAGELATIEAAVEAALGSEIEADIVWNHRGKARGETFADWHDAGAAGEREHVVRESGVACAMRARHRGLDPWLFLDLRAGRRVLAAECRDKSVLNLFAYTGVAGVAALVHGAREAWNVDFARSSLAVSQRNAELNAVPPEKLVTVEEDVFPIVRQLAGLRVKGRAAARKHLRLEARRFDIVFLDPPASARSPFGAVDVERDYPALFKPSLLALADGGTLIATNHAAAVAAEDWRVVLVRCAEKAGRPLRDVTLIAPDDDFPSFDGRPPLKIAVCRV